MLKGSHEDSDSSNYSNGASNSNKATHSSGGRDRDGASDRSVDGCDSDRDRVEARRGLVNNLLEGLDQDEEEDDPVDYPLKSFIVAIFRGED